MKKIVVFILLLPVLCIFVLSCNDVETRLKKYSEMIQKNPNDSSAYSNRAHFYYSIKEYDKALLDLKKSIDIDENSVEYYDIATIHLILGNIQESFQNVNKAIEIRSKHNAERSFIHSSLQGICYDFLNKKNAAITAYSHFLQWKYNIYSNKMINDATTSEFFIVYIRRAMLYYEKSNYPLALSDVNMAMSIDDLNDGIYYLRFMIYQMSGNTELAKKDLIKALKVGFNDKKEIGIFLSRTDESTKKELNDIINKHISKSAEKEFDFTNKKYIVNTFLGMK